VWSARSRPCRRAAGGPCMLRDLAADAVSHAGGSYVVAVPAARAVHRVSLPPGNARPSSPPSLTALLSS
jgi:hypothetical protein